MKVVETYIAREDIKKYELHEAMQSGYSKLYEVFSKVINDQMSDEEIIDNELDLEASDEIDFKVTVNKKEVTPFKDYFITFNGNLLFRETIEKSSIINIYDTFENKRIATKNPYSRNVLFRIFSKDEKIKYNNQYTYKLTINEKEYNINFESKYNPYYSNVKKIRADLGYASGKFTDKEIAKLIYFHSKEIYKILKENNLLDELRKNTLAQDIARYRTDIDLCWLLYYGMSFTYGDISKEIGTMKIEKKTNIPDIYIISKRFEFLLNQAESKLNLQASDGIKISSYTDYKSEVQGEF